MRSAYLLLALLVLLAGLAACGESVTEPTPEEYAPELVVEASEALPPTPEPMPEEAIPEEPLPAHLQYIVDAGRFSGEVISGCAVSGDVFKEYAVYENTLLGLAYRFTEDEVYERPFFGVAPGLAPGGLMSAWAFGEEFMLSVIAGSGEQWARQQADDFIESYIEAWLRRDKSIREFLGDERDEEIALIIEMRSQNEQRRAERWAEFFPGMPLEEVIIPLTPDELDTVRFWPVEYEIADRIFLGLQINASLPGSESLPRDGSVFFMGRTFLFHQIDDDTALVVSIRSLSYANLVATRHINRFAALS